MKSIAPLSFATSAPAANVSLVTAAAAFGRVRSGGPPGFEPPTATSISRALSFVATQLKKNAAQSAFFAFAEIPYVSGADIAASDPLASPGGKTKKPTLLDISLSYTAFCQSPLNMNTPWPFPKRALASVYSMALTSFGK